MPTASEAELMGEPPTNNESAFPRGLSQARDLDGKLWTAYEQQGMTLRDWFAGQALIAMKMDNGKWQPNQLAKAAYDVADAMLKARKKGDDANDGGGAIGLREPRPETPINKAFGFTMTDKEFRALLNLYMVSDPWPLEDKESNAAVGRVLARESDRRGYEDWVGAYHEIPRKVE